MKNRYYQFFAALILATWLLVLREGSLEGLTERVASLRETVARRSFDGGDGQSGFQVLTAVGTQDCIRTRLAIKLLEKLQKELPEEVYIHTWAAPSRKEFDDWLEGRKVSGQVPASYTTAPVVFNRIENRRVFLGGLDELVLFISENFNHIDFSEEQAQYKALKKRKRTGVNSVVKAQTETNAPVFSDSAPVHVAKSLADEDAGVLVTPHSKFANDPVNAFPAQVALRPNLLYTKFTITDKSVTNHKPIGQALKGLGFGYMSGAPLLANWIIVQDQKTASSVIRKYQRSIINNIGYGGQSCFGGTKGKQVLCRKLLAEKDGCMFEDLGIQPPQYRLWVAEECNHFFNVVCSRPDEAKQLWMEKPSGGQHGVGMSVRDGCAEVKSGHPDCSSEASKKKFIVMPYLDPALLGNHKFDLRSFLLIASLKPQLVFYHDGFARKANSAYSHDVKDRNAHITNAVTQNSNDHFYSFQRLGETLHQESGFPEDYMTRIFREHAIKVENYIFHVSRKDLIRRGGLYQIFALDWIIDSNGGIHMLEANSNPLVTVYDDLKEEFTETWDGMTDLVLKVQTDPSALFSPENPRLVTEPERYQYRGWHLIFNELEEKETGKVFQPCKAKVSQFDLRAFKASGGKRKDTTAKKVDVASGPVVHKGNVGTNVEQDSKTSPFNPDEVPPYAVDTAAIQEALNHASKRPCNTLDPFSEFKGCVEIDRGFPNEVAIRCNFTTEENYMYIFEPYVDGKRVDNQCLPTILISAGMHGNEWAGVVAARYIRKHWPVSTARLVVVERLNARGVGAKTRYIPKLSKEERDLNRNFPLSGMIGDLSHQIWSVVSRLKPHVFVDMHEGWGVYGRLRSNYVQGGALVGNPKFSKGSSVISTASALPLAKVMVNRLNEQVVTDRTKYFFAIGPPIETGLANMINREFDALAVVIETTSQGQQLHLRGKEQLVLVSTLLALLGALPATFNGVEFFMESSACIAGHANCGLAHPDDVVLDTHASEPENENANVRTDELDLNSGAKGEHVRDQVNLANDESDDDLFESQGEALDQNEEQEQEQEQEVLQEEEEQEEQEEQEHEDEVLEEDQPKSQPQSQDLPDDEELELELDL